MLRESLFGDIMSALSCASCAKGRRKEAFCTMHTYTTGQKDLISGIIGTQILGRVREETLRHGLETLTSRLYADTLSTSDLERIQNILKFTLPDGCQTCNMEGYREQTEALLVTRRLLAQANRI